ncbi:MAG: GNAT family N-acetyltransferase [Verrucomicrobiaceae bacterium]|nr:GNAT family N-acetyltransferase [Verrucomicrobiaceae bacterium]
MPSLTLRPVTAEDTAFLFAVYASTREAELALTGWSTEQKAAFCAQQFHAQDTHYRQHYPGAQYFVIEAENQAAGRLYVDHGENEIRVMDIALLPQFRGKGIGTHYFRELQKEAQTASKVLSIHVEAFNPAKRLYERLGFQLAEDKGVYHFMTWTPEAAPQ